MKLHKIAIISLLIAAAFGCTHPHKGDSSHSSSARQQGVRDAQRELTKGILAVETFGLSPIWTDGYNKILKDKYGIQNREVAGCMVDTGIIEHAEGFNEVMIASIKQKWPMDVFDEANKQAQNDYEHQKRLDEETLFKATATINVPVSGSVLNPGIYPLKAPDNTLSKVLEASGGFSPLGSDFIDIKHVTLTEKTQIWRVRGSEYYAGNVDFILPPNTRIFIMECAGLGLSNFSKESFDKLNIVRTDYLKRRTEGKITNIELSSP